jgi:hypothetical protein
MPKIVSYPGNSLRPYLSHSPAMMSLCPTFSYEIWSSIMSHLIVPPSLRDNGIACANRIMNTRWRAYVRKIFKRQLQNIIRWIRGRQENGDNPDILLDLLDLQDLLQ